MMLPTDIKSMLYSLVIKHPVLKDIPEIKPDKHKPIKERKEAKERIVINSNASDNEDWQHTYAHVCIFVPDIDFTDKGTTYPVADDERFDVLGKAALELFGKRKVFEYEGNTCYYDLVSIIQEEDEATWSHYLNIRLKVTNSNFKF